MAKVIRTAQVGGSVVTLGMDEGSLYMIEEEEAEEGRLDLAGLIGARIEQVREELTEEWEGKLRQEHATMRAAADRQLDEAEGRRRTEVEQVSRERYEEGFAAGVASKEDEAKEAVTRLDVLHESLKAERSQVLVEAETTVVDLAVAMARRIIGAEVEIDPKILIRVVRSAMQHLAPKSNLVIKVNEADLQIARKFAQHWVTKVDEDAVLKVSTSAHVERGGCMIEGTEENVDARVGEQLQALHDALRDVIESSDSDESAGSDESGETAESDESVDSGDRGEGER